MDVLGTVRESHSACRSIARKNRGPFPIISNAEDHLRRIEPFNAQLVKLYQQATMRHVLIAS